MVFSRPITRPTRWHFTRHAAYHGIGTIQSFLFFLLSIVIGRAFDKDHLSLLIVLGSSLAFSGLTMASLALVGPWRMRRHRLRLSLSSMCHDCHHLLHNSAGGDNRYRRRHLCYCIPQINPPVGLRLDNSHYCLHRAGRVRSVACCDENAASTNKKGSIAG